MLLQEGVRTDSGAVADAPTAGKATAEQVAKVVAGIAAIGQARRVLQDAGWCATIAGNRITVNDEVFAKLTAAASRRPGGVDAMWSVHAITGEPPVWVVGTGMMTNQFL